MEYQPMHGNGGTAGAGTSGSASGGGGGGGEHLHHHHHQQCLHSPRMAAGGGSMTRRASSFKRGAGGEIELQIGSPRSPRCCDGLGSPPSESVEPSGSGLHHHHHQSQQNQHLRFRLFKPLVSGGGSAIEVGLGLGIWERRKLGNMMFLAFCGVCLLLGVAGSAGAEEMKPKVGIGLTGGARLPA